MIVDDRPNGGLDDSGIIRRRWADAGAPEQDPIASMHDTTEEAGDEAGLTDTYCMDRRSAEDLSVALDPSDAEQSDLA